VFFLSCFLVSRAEIFHIVNGGKQLETKKDSQSVGGDPAPKKTGTCCG